MLTRRSEDGRRKLFEAHRHEFGARDITWEMFRQPNNTTTTTTTTTNTTDGDLEITPAAAAGTKKVAFADRKTTIEAGEIVPGSRRVALEAGKIVFADLVVDRPPVAVRAGGRRSAS